MNTNILKFLSLSVFAVCMASPYAAHAQILDIPEDGTQEIVLDNLSATDAPAVPPQLVESNILDEMEALIDAPAMPDASTELSNDDALKALLPPETEPVVAPEINSVENVAPAPVVEPNLSGLAEPAQILPIAETLEMETVTKKAVTPAKPKQVRPTFFDSEDIKFKEKEFKDKTATGIIPTSKPADPSKVVVVRKAVKADSQQARIVAAQRALALGRYESALRMYDALYDLNPRDPNVLAGRATAMQKLGRFDESIIGYEELFEVDAGNVEAQVNMLGMMSEKYPSVALKRLKMLHEEHPDNVMIVAQMGIAHGRLGSYEDAITALGMAASMEPRNAEHIFNMAVISDRGGYHDEAMAYYEQALETDSIYGASRSVPRDAIYERLVLLRN